MLTVNCSYYVSAFVVLVFFRALRCKNVVFLYLSLTIDCQLITQKTLAGLQSLLNG